MVQITNRLKLIAKAGSDPVMAEAMKTLVGMGPTPENEQAYKDGIYFFESSRNKDIYASQQYYHKYDEVMKVLNLSPAEKLAFDNVVFTHRGSTGGPEYGNVGQHLLTQAQQLAELEKMVGGVAPEQKDKVIDNLNIIAGHLQHVEKEGRIEGLSGPDENELNLKTMALMTSVYGFKLSPDEMEKKVSEFNKLLTDNPQEIQSILETAKEKLKTGHSFADIIQKGEGTGAFVAEIDPITGKNKWDPKAVPEAPAVATTTPAAPTAVKSVVPPKPDAAAEDAAITAMKKIREEYFGKDGNFKLERGYSKGLKNEDVGKFQDLLEYAGIVKYTEGQPYTAQEAKDVKTEEGKILIAHEHRGHNMGAVTEEAVKELQKKFGLEMTGVFSEKEFHAAYALTQSKGDLEEAKRKYTAYNAVADHDRAVAETNKAEPDKKTVDTNTHANQPLVFNSNSVKAALKDMGAKDEEPSSLAASDAGQKQRVEGLSGPSVI